MQKFALIIFALAILTGMAAVLSYGAEIVIVEAGLQPASLVIE